MTWWRNDPRHRPSLYRHTSPPIFSATTYGLRVAMNIYLCTMLVISNIYVMIDYTSTGFMCHKSLLLQCFALVRMIHVGNISSWRRPLLDMIKKGLYVTIMFLCTYLLSIRTTDSCNSYICMYINIYKCLLASIAVVFVSSKNGQNSTFQRPLLLIWFNFNPYMDMYSHAQ